MKDKPITLAVVDSGVNIPHPHLPAVEGGTSFDSEGQEQEDFTDVLGHGTAVTSAIYEKAPDAHIFVVKVFNQQLATSVPILMRALDWASEHHEIRAYDLAPAVERAVSRGTIIVSARANEEQFWYPGCMEGVLGVVLNWEHPRESVSVIEVEESPKAYSTRVVSASGYPRPIPGIPNSRNLNGISFAVANTTGVLAALLTDRPDVRSAEAAFDLLSEVAPLLE